MPQHVVQRGNDRQPCFFTEIDYVRYINDRYHRTGTLWEGRYKACLIDTDSYLLRCYRYIGNPGQSALSQFQNFPTPYADTFLQTMHGIQRTIDRTSPRRCLHAP